MQALRLTMSWVCLLLRASISSLCQKTSWMGMSGLCSSGSFELTPSVCTSLPKTGAREESGDTHSLQHLESQPNTAVILLYPIRASKSHAKGDRPKDRPKRRRGLGGAN